MDYDKKQLVHSGNGQIVDIDGRYICSISCTDRYKALLDNEGWDRNEESWINYRRRTDGERKDESVKRDQLANDIVEAYNISISNSGYVRKKRS